MSKALEATKAYVERLGFELLDEVITPDSFLAMDGDEKVLVLTSVGYDTGVEPTEPTKIPEANVGRVDLIRLIVIAPDRALLRHERNFSLEKDR